MSEEVAAPADEPEGKHRFTLPSAYTILFVLIVVAAIATWVIPAGTYELNDAGEPKPGTYHKVEAKPSRIVVDSLTAPINGLYGIEDAKGNINYYNSGTLFGAIDIALFILVIGGFLGVTLSSGAIQAGIGRLVDRMRGRERWMIPVLMGVFALGGTSFGMAEESLAFYALVISVMIAAGYDALVGAAVVLLGCGIGVLGSTVNPFATGIASGIAGVPISEGLIGRLVILLLGLAIGIFFVLRYADRVKQDPDEVGRVPDEGRQRGALPGRGPGRERGAHRHAQGDPGGVRARVRRDDLRGDPVGGHGHPDPHLVLVVPGDDRLLPAVRDHHRSDRPHARKRADEQLRRRRARPPRGRADHRHRPRHHRDHEQRPDHRHGAALDRECPGRHGRGRVLDRDVRPLPAVVVPHPLDVGARDAGDAHHRAAGGVRDVPESLVVTAYQSAAGVMNLFIPTSAVVMGGLAIARVPYGTYLRWVWPLLAALAALCIVVLAITAVVS